MIRRLGLAIILLSLTGSLVYGAYCGKFSTAPPPPPPSGGGGPVAALPCAFFVSPTGSDSNNGTSRATAFQTLGKVQSAMQGKTTASAKVACLMAGTYNVTSTVQLTAADAQETWEFDPNSGPNTAVLDGGSAHDIFVMTGSWSGLTINGIKMQNVKDFALWSESQGQSNIVLQNSDIGHNVDSTECCSPFAAIVTLSAGGGSEGGPGGPLFVFNNYIHDTVAQGLSIYAFNAGDSVNGTVISGNVVINACQVTSDCGGIYFDQRNAAGLAGSATISNNFVRDYGNGTEAEGIYLDDDTSHVTVTGNIVGPMNPNATGNPSTTIVNGGTDNLFKNNIFDVGKTGKELVGRASNPGGGGAIFFNWNGQINAWNNNIIVADYAGSTTNVVNGAFWTDPDYPAGNGAAANNMIHNYGGGQESTNGPVINDVSPVHQDPLCSTYLYALAAQSPAFNPPTSFPAIKGGFGPPGFTIPTSTNVSCPTTPAPQGLPVPVLGMYLDNNGGGPSIASILANHPQYNHLTYIEASGDSNANLTLDLTAAAGDNLATDITNWKASTDKRGNHRTVTLLICDSGTPGCGAGAFTNGTQATNAFNSIVSLVNQYGFQGVEWDLEGSEGTTWNKTTIDSIDSQLKTQFGSTFIIGQTPRPFETHAGSTKRGWMQTMDYSMLQYYVGGDINTIACSAIQGLEAGTDGNSEGMSQYVNGSDGGVTLPANKVIFGQEVQGAGQSGCAPSDYEAAWAGIQGAYPTQRGVSVWRSGVDQSNGFTFGSTFGPPMGLQ